MTISNTIIPLSHSAHVLRNGISKRLPPIHNGSSLNVDKVTLTRSQVREKSRHTLYSYPADKSEHGPSHDKIITLNLPISIQQDFSLFVKSFNKDPYVNPNLVRAEMAKKLKSLLPSEMLYTLHFMGKTGQPDLVLINNFPIDQDIPNTGDIGERLRSKGAVSESAMLGLVGLMGYKLQSIPKEQEGRVIHNVTPVLGKYNTQSSKGRDPFYLHTENPFESHPPHFLILVGLTGDNTAKTSFFHIDALLRELPKWVTEGMKKPDFRIRSGAGVDGIEEGRFPLLSTEIVHGEEHQRLRLYQHMERIAPKTEEASRVLDYVGRHFENIEKAGQDIYTISLQPGQALVFNNGWGLDRVRGVMHGRLGYISNPNRWLQRGFFHPEDEPIT